MVALTCLLLFLIIWLPQAITSTVKTSVARCLTTLKTGLSIYSWIVSHLKLPRTLSFVRSRQVYVLLTSFLSLALLVFLSGNNLLNQRDFCSFYCNNNITRITYKNITYCTHTANITYDLTVLTLFTIYCYLTLRSCRTLATIGGFISYLFVI